MNGQQHHSEHVNRDRSKEKAWRRAYIRNGLYCFIVLLILAFSVVPMSGCMGRIVQAETGPAASGPAAGEQAAGTSTDAAVPVKPDETLTILAVGDIMMHDTMLNAGWQAASKSYDYAYMFEKVSPILQKGDLVIGNLEVPLAGADVKYTGYPMFNAPEILAKNLKDAGFDMVGTANNHCLDRRYGGLVKTLDHLDAAGLLHSGTSRSAEEQDRVTTMTVKGVNIALISATYGTNGMVLPEGKDDAVNDLDPDRLLEQIEAARKNGAQYVIMMLHWGQEYQPLPNDAQKALAATLLTGGADLILGSHPHVLQTGGPVEISLDAVLANPAASAGSDSGEREKYQTRFVMYSLGNFISGQKGLERLSSLILNVTLRVDGKTGAPSFEGASYIPLYTQKKDRNGRFHFVVWPIETALEEVKKPGHPFSAEDVSALKKAWDHVLASQPSMRYEPVSAILSEDSPSRSQ
jgi:poly-gamma-glutamate synthesis protein (capsule biosynthesis protein)